MNAILLAALLQVAPPQPQQQLPPSPIQRIEVTPANPTVVAQDTLRLAARALDAQGAPVPNALVRFVAAGGQFEGRVEESGLVRSGATGTLPVSVIASVPGTAPVVERIEVRMVPGPAARVEVQGAVPTLIVGQRVPLQGRSYSGEGDLRPDRIQWRSSAPTSDPIRRGSSPTTSGTT